MEHSFNVQFAQRYGIEEAIIVHNFYFWLLKNLANEKHLHDGRVWTYNSNNAFSKLFPYINKTKIFRVLKHLEDECILIKDCFNKDARDRTLWYSFSDYGLEIISSLGYKVDDFKMKNCIVQNEKCTVQNETTIPYNEHTDSIKEKEDNKLSSQKNELKLSDYIEIHNKWEETNPNLPSIRCFNEKRKKALRTLLKNNNATIDDLYKVFEIISVCSFCQGSNDRGWTATLDWVLNDTKSCFNRLLEGAYAFNDSERQKVQQIVSGVQVEQMQSEQIVINGVIYK
jgi:hypothetical protein